MSVWAREHRALHGALRANAIVPPLVRRLSLERVSPDDDEIRRLRGWASTLRADPGWAAIEPVIDNPEAWPRAWEAAVAAGFSAASDHHHALLFGRFCEGFAHARDWDGAAWTWNQSVDAWARVFASDYPGTLFDDIAPKLSDEGPDRAQMLREMLDGLIDDRRADLREAAGLARPGDAPQVESRRLRFAWRALQQLATVATDRADPHGTLRRLQQLAQQACASVNAELVGRFEKSVTEIDLSAATGDALLGPFRWVSEYFTAVGFTELAVTTMISAVVETCWSLRRLGRDESADFAALIDVARPFNRDLFARLVSFDSAFGHNSRCADFLVFVGENQTGPARRVTFEAGLEVCPGHRNSAMLLSYEDLGEARKIIAQVALTPALAARVPNTQRRVQSLLADAQRLLDKADDTYPYNEALPDARESLATELRRLNVTLD